MTRARTAAEWRAMVYRDRGISEHLRVFLLLLGDHMNDRRMVSVPYSKLADALGVSATAITKRRTAAIETGFLDVVQAGKPGITTTYQGLFPDPALVHPQKVYKQTTPLVRGRVYKQRAPLVHPQGVAGSSKRLRTEAASSSPNTDQATPAVHSSNSSPPTSPNHKQTDTRTPNHHAHPSQTDDPQPTYANSTEPSSHPATDQAGADSSVNGVSDSAATRLDEPAIAFATRPTTSRPRS